MIERLHAAARRRWFIREQSIQPMSSQLAEEVVQFSLLTHELNRRRMREDWPQDVQA